MRGSRQTKVRWRILAALLLSGVAACQPTEPAVTGNAFALQGPQAQLAMLCGFECAPRGVDNGNAVISGVTEVDAFFAAVVGYERGADALSTAIKRELKAIGGDFGAKGDLGPENRVAHTEDGQAPAAGVCGRARMQDRRALVARRPSALRCEPRPRVGADGLCGRVPGGARHRGLSASGGAELRVPQLCVVRRRLSRPMRESARQGGVRRHVSRHV